MTYHLKCAHLEEKCWFSPFIFAPDLCPAKNKQTKKTQYTLRPPQCNKERASSPVKPSDTTQSGQLNSSSPSLLPTYIATWSWCLSWAASCKGPVSKQGSRPRWGQPPTSFPGADRAGAHSEGDQWLWGTVGCEPADPPWPIRAATVHQVSGLLGRAVLVK